MNKFWNWLQHRLGIESLDYRLTYLDEQLYDVVKELAILRKKVIRKPQRYDQVERDRSSSRHPARHR